MKFAQLKFLKTNMPKGIQARVDFGKYELSVVKNSASYGNQHGLYEIAVFEENKQVELPGITQEGDTVKGFLNEADIDGIMLKMSFATRTEGKNVND